MDGNHEVVKRGWSDLMRLEEIKVLIIEDDAEDADLIVQTLSSEKHPAYKIECVDRLSKGLEMLNNGTFDVVLLDLSLPDSYGMDTVTRAIANSPGIPFVVLTGLDDPQAGLEAVRTGAQDYLVKNKIDTQAMSKALQYAVLRERLEQLKDDRISVMSQRIKPPQSALEDSRVFSRAPAASEESLTESPERKSTGRIAHVSKSMKKILATVDKIARENVPVLIYGETGTGKELIAAAIHHNTHNPRKEKPFISINCAALAEGLLESELFGHARGAFTGAVSAKQGILEAISGGTLFLDEISDASPSIQAKLLRVLDSGDYLKLGETHARKVDVRLLAATNKNIPDEISMGRFREDLYQRLKAVTLYLPPLRERPEDIPILVQYYLDYFNRISNKEISIDADAMRALEQYHWIGNIRELKHLVQNVVIMADSPTAVIRLGDLPDIVLDRKPGHAGKSTPAIQTAPPLRLTETDTLETIRTGAIRKAEEEYFVVMLKKYNGNVTHAAHAAKISRRHMTQKLKELGIDSKVFKSKRTHPVL